MRLLIDADVLLEFVAERQASAEEWGKLHALELTGAAELWVIASTYDTLRRALDAVLPDEEVRGVLRSTMSFLSVCSVDGPDIRFALDRGSVPFQAALTESCARKIQADFIITRQGPIDLSRAIRRVAPDELFSVLEQERGIVFDLIEW
ncbi:PIN domain-containing protein [Adlercreutzia sp. R21]|uniref:PIN domain-containing protein n=1 Tax=Adlercreutzia wanghongyangiae TaxID=3111451 RepID=A0ABU6IH48_9ACTN|nr:PIN domain-containing protein [Adlercreutzia sp. R21]MEC4175755.1 PIN domain-containing protein [Adlercreutzia sp. R7]MEC4183792.1 PIN domain-containing protein [Adlercreutzia sp. R21]